MYNKVRHCPFFKIKLSLRQKSRERERERYQSTLRYVDGPDSRFWLRWHNLGDRNSENAILHGSLHIIDFGVLRELKTPEKAPLRAFHTVPPV